MKTVNVAFCSETLGKESSSVVANQDLACTQSHSLADPFRFHQNAQTDAVGSAKEKKVRKPRISLLNSIICNF